MSGGGRRVGAVLAAALFWAACAGPGYDYEDLPEAPIAFVYRSNQEAEIVADWAAEKRSNVPKGAGGTIRLEDVGRVFGIYGTEEDRAEGILGRLAFLDPRTREVELPGFAARGSRPLAWAPDRDRLLFVAFRGKQPHVFEWERASGEVRPLTSGNADHVDACYGPDGAIVFSRIEGGASRIFVWEPRGGPPRALSDGPADADPAWSPKGDLVAFRTTDETGREAVATIDPTDPDAEPDVLSRGRTPVFTPDGEWIVFSRQTRGGWKLHRMRPDGSGRRPLGTSPRDEHDPTVSPDGRFVAYVASSADRQKLWVRPMEGGGDRPLLFDGDALLPAW